LKANSFYRAFEDKFRGSRELIKSRLQVYLQFIVPVRDCIPIANAIDLGCGRGEWLELLGEHGFEAQGVDIDDGMLVACRERNLKVDNSDALDFIKKLPKASHAVVSGFHIVEHVPFEYVQELIKESLRILIPGGLLILETPNPENLVVGTANFYLDPTHQRPIPPPLLAFASEYAGFKRTKVMRLQESNDLSQKEYPSILDVLNGVSPDYAVISQKEGAARIIKATSLAFETEYGLTLETLAIRHQIQADARSSKAEQSEAQEKEQLKQALETVHQTQALMQEALSRADQAELDLLLAKDLLDEKDRQLLNKHQELHDVHQANHYHWAELDKTRNELYDVYQANHYHWQLANEREIQLQALYSSRSWLITAPIRWVTNQARKLRREGLGARLKALIKKVLRKVSRLVSSRPVFRQRIINLSKKVGLYGYLKSLDHRLYPRCEPEILERKSLIPQKIQIDNNPELVHMTPRAREIFYDLKSALERIE